MKKVLLALIVAGCVNEASTPQAKIAAANTDLQIASTAVHVAALECVAAASAQTDPRVALDIDQNCQMALGPVRTALETAAQELSQTPDSGIMSAGCAGLLAVNALQTVVTKLNMYGYKISANGSAAINDALVLVDTFIQTSSPLCAGVDSVSGSYNPPSLAHVRDAAVVLDGGSYR